MEVKRYIFAGLFNNEKAYMPEKYKLYPDEPHNNNMLSMNFDFLFCNNENYVFQIGTIKMLTL